MVLFVDLLSNVITVTRLFQESSSLSNFVCRFERYRWIFVVGVVSSDETFHASTSVGWGRGEGESGRPYYELNTLR